MFGIGLPELLLIMAVALIVVGPEKLPELAKSLAKGILELKKTAGALKDSLTEADEPQAPPPPWKQLTEGKYPPEVTGVNAGPQLPADTSAQPTPPAAPQEKNDGEAAAR